MSAYQYRLADARADIGLRNIAATCANGTQFADYVNRATRRLIKRGSWYGTDALLKLCTNGCDVVFPRQVGTVIGLRLCQSGAMEIRNNWWAIVSPANCGYGAGWNQGWGNSYGYGGGMPYSTDTNSVPIFNQVSGNTGKLIRYHVVAAQDIGKTITIYGKKYGGQPLQEEVAGVIQNGITITAATPFSQTTDLVTKIDSVVRQATSSPAYLYEYDPATMLLRMLGSYEPSETNPSYRHMRIPQLSCVPHSTDENGVHTWHMEALVKLQYIPVVSDNDFLLIDDFDALSFAIQSIKFDEANDAQNAQIYMLKAIESLNFEMREKSPSDQLSVRVQVNGPNYCLQSPY